MIRGLIYFSTALALAAPLQAKNPLKSLRLSDMQLYAPSVEPGYVMHGNGLFKTDFVINDRGVEFMQVTSRRGGKRGERTHEGIDIAAPHGSEIIYLGFDGENALVHTGFQARGCGRYAFLERNNIATLFCHLSDIAVEDGTVIEPGAVIGRVGTSGHSTGSRLHYERREDGSSLPLERAARLR